MVKTRSDLDRYRHIIETSHPDGIIEIGTLWGTSAVWFARTGRCPVFTIDINPQVSDDTMSAAVRQGVRFHLGPSTDGAAVRQVGRWMARHHIERPLVTIDGNHAASTVREELDLYAPMVAPDGWLVVEDTLIRWSCPEVYPQGGPLDALEGWLPDHPEFEQDLTVEDMFETTQHPGGWLRRRTHA